MLLLQQHCSSSLRWEAVLQIACRRCSTQISFKKAKTNLLSKHGSLPRNIAGWNGICWWSGKVFFFFFLWVSNLWHSSKVMEDGQHLNTFTADRWFTPNQQVRVCAQYEGPIVSWQKMTSVHRIFVMNLCYALKSRCCTSVTAFTPYKNVATVVTAANNRIQNLVLRRTL